MPRKTMTAQLKLFPETRTIYGLGRRFWGHGTRPSGLFPNSIAPPGST